MIPSEWENFLSGEYDPAALNATWEKVALRRSSRTVFPPESKVFRALELTAPGAVRAVILGQDPYHDDGQAQGLAFSVPEGMKTPPSLRNIFKEYATDLNRPVPRTPSLELWAEHGVLLLNAVLTVDAHNAGSHAAFGWERFTDAVVRALSRKREGIVFLLWGASAWKKKPLIDPERHHILESPHPSPLSAYRGFFGSRPFSRTEELLGDWRWPEIP